MDHPLGALIEEEVRRAESDLEGQRGRALGLINVAGALVTLVTGFGVLAARSEGDVVPAYGGWVLAAALVAYVSAAVFALLANRPLDVDAPDEDELQAHVLHEWDRTDWDREVADTLVNYLRSLRTANAAVARHLVVSLWLEIAGIAITAVLGLLIVANAT